MVILVYTEMQKGAEPSQQGAYFSQVGCQGYPSVNPRVCTRIRIAHSSRICGNRCEMILSFFGPFLGGRVVMGNLVINLKVRVVREGLTWIVWINFRSGIHLSGGAQVRNELDPSFSPEQIQVRNGGCMGRVLAGWWDSSPPPKAPVRLTGLQETMYT